VVALRLSPAVLVTGSGISKNTDRAALFDFAKTDASALGFDRPKMRLGNHSM
jgi:hypothetical protein